MAKKLIVLETFEQGMDRKDGGALKLLVGSQLPAEETDHGLVVTGAGGKKRTLAPALVKKLTDTGLVRIDSEEA